MRRSHTIAFATLILLAALGAWLASSMGADLQGDAPAPRGPAPATAPAGETGGEPAVDRRELAAAPPDETATAAPATPPPAPTGRLAMLVVDERGAALAGCQVTAAAHEGSTDRAGAVQFEVEAARTFVSVEPPANHGLRGRSGWQTVRAGTTTRVTIVLAPASNLVLWCQLVAAEDGHPLPGVELRQRPGDTVLRSDAGGFVQVAVLDDSTFFDAHAAGRSPCRIVPEAGHEARDAALRVPLAKGCTVHVRTVDSADSPVANVSLRLRVLPWHLQCPREVRARGEPFTWTAASDVRGELTFTDLPTGAAIEVQVDAPAPYAAVDDERWALAAVREERRIRLAAAGVVRGTVTDAAGAPVAGVAVQANAAEGAAMPRVLELAAVHRKATTGADGAFQLAGLAPGKWWIGIGHDGLHQPSSVAVDVAAGRAAEIELRAVAGLAIAGRAIAADGAPCRGVPIQIMVGDTFVAGVGTDHDGRFRFAGLPAGTCELSVDPFETDLGLAEPVAVQAGDEQVELRLIAVNGSISGRSSGTGDVWVTAYRRGGSDVLGSRCELDGTFFYRGLRAGTWDLTAMDRAGRAATLGGVQVLPGRETAGVGLELVAGATLRPRHDGADEFVVCNGAHVAGGDSLQVGLAGEARVPPGTWTVVFRQRGREVGRRDVTVRAGESRVVDGGR